MIQTATAAELRRLVEEGLIPEGHFVDFKRELTKGRSANHELARDLASLAVDGGQYVLGFDEDKQSRRFAASPVALQGVAERISQVALSLVDPPLQIRSTEIPDDDAGNGFLVVDVFASPQAPHQVDGRFWGRNDTTKYPLGHSDVLRILADRLTRSTELSRVLDAEVDRDPVPADRRSNAHLHVVAAPTLGRPSMLQEALSRRGVGWRDFIQASILGGSAGQNLGQSWAPDLNIASTVSRRANGWALHSYEMGPDRRLIANGDHQPREENLLDLEIDENGSVHLFAGRAGDEMRGTRFLIEVVVAGLTIRVIRAANTVAERTGYVGPWYAGVAVTGLLGLTSLQLGQRVGYAGTAYSEDHYSEGAEFSAAEIPEAFSVADRLLGRLWRGLGSTFSAAELTQKLTST